MRSIADAERREGNKPPSTQEKKRGKETKKDKEVKKTPQVQKKRGKKETHLKTTIKYKRGIYTTPLSTQPN